MQIFYFKNFTEAKQGQYLRLILSLTDESEGLICAEEGPEADYAFDLALVSCCRLETN